MHTITINIENDTLVERVLWLLEHFKKDGLEIIRDENIKDLELLEKTRDEKTISFEEYLKNEN
jgi:hypothetical protein